MQVDQLVEGTFYTLYHDYGTVVTIKRLTKRNVDPETGEREDDIGFTADAVFTPVGMVNSYLVKMLGRADEATTVFMVRLNAGQEVKPSDTVIHGNRTYRELDVQVYGLIALVAGREYT